MKDHLNENNSSWNETLLSSNEEVLTTSYSSFLDSENNHKDKIKDVSSVEAENQRFTKYSPLVTLLIMSIGPLSNLVSVVFETLNMYLISKRFNQIENSHAVEIIGFSSQFQNLLLLIGNFFGQCFITQVSSLIGSGKRERAEQLSSDLFKITIIISIFYSVVMLFVVKPFLKFVGTPDNILESAFKFNVFHILFIPFSNLFTLSFCFLQSIGNSILLAIIVVSSKIVQSAILTPFFLFVCKVPTTYMKVSNIVVETLFSIFMFIFVFIGKFSLKPTFSMFFTLKLSKDTINSLLYPLPYIIAFIGNCFAPMLILKCLTSYNDDSIVNQAIGGVYAVFNQLYSINQALPSSFVVAFLATGNHAFGSRNIKRFIKLLSWTLIISISIGIIFSFVVIIFKTQIASWFIKSDLELSLSSKMLPIPFYTSFLLGFGLTVYSSLLVVKKPILSMIPLAAQIVILCIGSEVFKIIFKDDFVKIFHVYNCSDLICLVIYLVEFVYVIRIIIKASQNDVTLSNNDVVSTEQNGNKITI